MIRDCMSALGEMKMTDLSAEKLAELRKIAGKATPGPWDWYTDGNPVDGATGFAVHSKSDTEDSRVGFDLAVMEYDQMGQLDASHIAAFDPPTVLALLDRIEQQDAELAEYRNREAESRVEETQWGYLGRDGVVYHNATRRAAKQFKPREVPFLRREKRSYCTEWKEVVDDD